jgi:hypothetical protein
LYVISHHGNILGGEQFSDSRIISVHILLLNQNIYYGAKRPQEQVRKS